MIKLDVKDYCQACPDFEAAVRKPDTYYAEGRPYVVGDTIVRCEYREQCERLKKRLES